MPGSRPSSGGAFSDGLRESRRLLGAGQSLLETPRLPSGGTAVVAAVLVPPPGTAVLAPASVAEEVTRLRAQLEGECNMRLKLQKFLEVQSVQVQLQQQLRLKTERLLQAEQAASARVRQQLEDVRRRPGECDPLALESEVLADQRLQQAQGRIQLLESQLALVSAPETSERSEALLRRRLDEQERLLEQFRQQVIAPSAGARAAVAAADDGELLRLQLLLQCRDHRLDELSQELHKASTEAAIARAEADALKHQVRLLRRDAAESSEDAAKSLRSERDLRVQVFALKDNFERSVKDCQVERQRATDLQRVQVQAEDRLRRIAELEKELAAEQDFAKKDREVRTQNAQKRAQAQEQVIRQQTAMVESLTQELKELQEGAGDGLSAWGGSPLAAAAARAPPAAPAARSPAAAPPLRGLLAVR